MLLSKLWYISYKTHLVVSKFLLLLMYVMYFEILNPISQIQFAKLEIVSFK